MFLSFRNLLWGFMVKSIILILAVLLSSSFSLAETVVLKNGKTIKGTLVSASEEPVKIDFRGVTLIYFTEDIQSIDSNDVQDFLKVKSPLEARQSEFYDFSIGSHNIRGNTIEFKFPVGKNMLYLFNLSDWKGPREDRAKLAVRLYDKDYKLIASSESLCLTRDFSSFGSVIFPQISKEGVADIVYFSMVTEDCYDKITNEIQFDLNE